MGAVVGSTIAPALIVTLNVEDYTTDWATQTTRDWWAYNVWWAYIAFFLVNHPFLLLECAGHGPILCLFHDLEDCALWECSDGYIAAKNLSHLEDISMRSWPVLK